MQTPPPESDRQADHPDADQPTTLGPPARQVFRLARRVWGPAPVPKPVIPTDLEYLTWPERSVAVVGHAMLSLEYWLSRGGWLREWVRLNLWLAVVLIVAALLVIPPVTAVLEGFRDWTGLMSATMSNINVAVAKVPPIVLAIATGFLVIKLIQRHRSTRRPRRQDCDDYR
jgi:hypothetical protein